MKRIFLIGLLFFFMSCDDDKNRTFYQDMMYFTENTSPAEGYISPVTHLDVKSNSQVELLVCRNAFAAKDHPKQTVQVVADPELSTAEEERDFSISASSLDFKNGNVTSLPLTVNIHNAKGKTIVLKLEYEYYDECPLADRKADRLKIKIE